MKNSLILAVSILILQTVVSRDLHRSSKVAKNLSMKLGEHSHKVIAHKRMAVSKDMHHSSKVAKHMSMKTGETSKAGKHMSMKTGDNTHKGTTHKRLSKHLKKRSDNDLESIKIGSDISMGGQAEK